MAVFKLQTNLFGITAALTTFKFATGLVGVFIPLVLFDAGAELWQICGFYVVYALTKLVINYPVAKYIIERRGVHVALGVGFLAAFVELFSLRFFTSDTAYWIVGAAVALALVNSCLWISEHLHISTVMDNATKSSSVATMQSFAQGAEVSAPLLGGLIAATFGPNWLLALASFVLLLALIPLRYVGRLHKEAQDEHLLKYSLRGAPKRDLFANFSFNIETAVGNLVWPIFLAIFIAGYREIGLISAFAGLVTVAAVSFAGHRGDKGHDRRVLAEGALMTSVINVVRTLASGTALIVVLTTAYRASLAYGQNAWVSNYYAHAKRVGPRYVMAMEIACDIAYVVLWSFLMVLALNVDDRTFFVTAFALAAISAWGSLLISKQEQRNGLVTAS